MSEHYIESRPWGSFEILSEFKVNEPGFSDSCIKILRLKPGASLSYQSHKQRNEHWFIVQGIGKVVLNDKDIEIKVGSSVDIKIGDKHRAVNTSADQELVIVESQTGHYNEDDIQRFEDQYGRA